MDVVKAIAWLAEHADLLGVIVDAIETKQIPKRIIITAIKDAMTRASDIAFERELDAFQGKHR
jgi:nucleoside-diphosphate-sugar epimerase